MFRFAKLSEEKHLILEGKSSLFWMRKVPYSGNNQAPNTEQKSGPGYWKTNESVPEETKSNISLEYWKGRKKEKRKERGEYREKSMKKRDLRTSQKELNHYQVLNTGQNANCGSRMRFGIVITLLLFTLITLTTLPTVIAPYWYGTSTSSEDYLVLHIPCEGNFDDRSGQGNDGTQSGGVSIGEGIKGRACEFDGVDGNV